MKNIVLLSVILTLATGLCFADNSDDTLKFYLGKSEMVVIGKITTVSGPIYDEAGVACYSCHFRIADVLKGDISLKGKTIGVGVMRFEGDKKDKHPLLKKDSECILFLKNIRTKEKPAWQTADFWFAIQHPSPSMARSLKRLAKQATVETADAPAKVVGQIERLSSPDADERGQACRNLGQMKEAAVAAIPDLIRLLGDKTEWRTWTWKPIPNYVWGLHIRRPVGEAAAHALREIGSQCIEPVMVVMKSDDSFVRENAVRAVYTQHDPRLIPLMIHALKDENPYVRRDSASWLGKFRAGKAVEPLIATLSDKEPSVRSRTVGALGKIGDTRAVVPLINALKDQDESVRACAAWGLARLKDVRATDPLVQTLKEAKWSGTRRAAAAALGAIGDVRAFTPLVEALRDDNRGVRTEAVKALGELGDTRAIRPLQLLVDDAEDRVRKAAAEALKHLGEVQEEAQPDAPADRPFGKIPGSS